MERKSRRTHKNLRDGCPNCKAKRIKCTEELPQCANCIKKQYRCGYLDFPSEKLDKIRRKNESKVSVLADQHDQLNQILNDNFQIDEPITDLLNLRLVVYKNSLIQILENFIEPPRLNMYDLLHIPRFKPVPYMYDSSASGSSNGFDTPQENRGTPLPGARPLGARFRVLSVPKNPFLDIFVENKGNLKSVNNQEYQFGFQPVWNGKIAHNFWMSVYHQLEVLELYNSFFLDRSLNILLTIGNVIVDADSQSATSTPGSSQLSPYSETSTDPCATSIFNKEDLAVLTRRSYALYGRLIRHLRDLLTLYHIEYPAKILLFSLWLAFLHIHSNADTLCVMLNGTALLFNKIAQEASTADDITKAIKVSLDLSSRHAQVCYIPDYHIGVIHQIQHHLRTFQRLCEQATEKDKLSRKRRRDSELADDPVQHFLTSNYFHQDLSKLSKFLDKLVTDYYPTLMRINSHYTGLASSNIHYTSFTLLFEILRHWFRVFSSEALAIGLRANPYKKTFFLFYSAVGRALVHIISPIRSVMLVDTCHIICPQIDFEPELHHFKNFGASWPEVHTIYQHLLRMVRFFDYRLLFYSYHFAVPSILDKVYLRAVGHDATLHEHYGDILHIVPGKGDFSEKLVNDFATETISWQHFPKFESFTQDDDLALAITNEQVRTNYVEQAPAHFDPDAGLFTTDFNPRPLLDTFFKKQEFTWEYNRPDLYALRTMAGNLEQARRQIKFALDSKDAEN